MKIQLGHMSRDEIAQIGIIPKIILLKLCVTVYYVKIVHLSLGRVKLCVFPDFVYMILILRILCIET